VEFACLDAIMARHLMHKRPEMH